MLLLFGLSMLSVLLQTGCGPTFSELRVEGQQEAANRDWSTARVFFEDAGEQWPEHAENLHDLGVCSMMLARRQFERGNRPAGMREVDRAIAYFTRAVDAHPGFRPALMGKNRALELKGQFEEALRSAHWAARFVGPSAEQYLYLAAEYEERGDLDQAFLRYRQAIAVEPDSAAAYRAMGLFHHRTGRREPAIQALTESLRLNPRQRDVADLLRSLGADDPALPASVTG